MLRRAPFTTQVAGRRANLYHLAVDIGASSGRLMAGSLSSDGRLVLEEIHRFPNAPLLRGDQLCWDVDSLLQSILTGLEKAKRQGITDCSLGIDTWGVDYCLIGSNNERIGHAVAYRDARTEGAIARFEALLSLGAIYEKTGIQMLPFNTLFQLFVEDQEKLKQADKLLLMPDYLVFCLTGKKYMERTNASTTQLLNVHTQELDADILGVLNVRSSLFPDFIEAGTTVGRLLRENFPDRDLPEVEVVAVGSHDTASAVLGTPAVEGENWAYISSGTWSLLGVETSKPLTATQSFHANYTNEGGVNRTIRFLKNIMGMWLIQEVARQHKDISYPQFVERAKQEKGFRYRINVNDPSFLHPDNMVTAIRTYCEQTNQDVPDTPGRLARAIFDNLAFCYAQELAALGGLVGKTFDVVHIVGGGCQNDFLNQLTADLAQIRVEAGPVEATALGNILMQMLGKGEISGVAAARAFLRASFPTRIFLPRESTSQSEGFQY